MARNIFENVIDVILEDAESFKPVRDAVGRLSASKQTVSNAEQELRRQVHELNARLASEIRRNNPSLSVAIIDGKCVVQLGDYRRKLTLRPDVERSIFICGNSKFDRGFIRRRGHTLGLDLPQLGREIADFFKANYRSIEQEDLP